MAKNDPAPKKPRWYKLIAQAYTSTAPHDKLLLPFILLAVLGPIALGVLAGIAIGGTVAIDLLRHLWRVRWCTRGPCSPSRKRFEKTAYGQMAGRHWRLARRGAVHSQRLVVRRHAGSRRHQGQGRDLPRRWQGRHRADRRGRRRRSPPRRHLHQAPQQARSRRSGARHLRGQPSRARCRSTKLTREIRKGKTVLTRSERETVSAPPACHRRRQAARAEGHRPDACAPRPQGHCAASRSASVVAEVEEQLVVARFAEAHRPEVVDAPRKPGALGQVAHRDRPCIPRRALP